MKFIKLLVLTLTFSLCSLVYAEYGMISFSKEVSSDLKIGHDINFYFMGTLIKQGIMIQPLIDQVPIKYQSVKPSTMTIEPIIKQDLQKFSTTQNLEGIIFGHIIQNVVKEKLYVVVHLYSVDSPEQYKTFGYEEVMGIKIQEMELQLIKVRLTQISEQIKHWLQEKQLQQQSQIALIPKKLVKKTSFPRKELQTLTEIYTMLYEENFRAFSKPEYEKHLQNVAQENGFSSWQALNQQLQNNPERLLNLSHTANCRQRSIISVSQKKQGHVYKLWFEPSYLFPRRWRCPAIPLLPLRSRGRLVNRTYKGTQQELKNLNARANNQDWRMPKLEELFAIAHLLPKPFGKRTHLFWSSTKQSPQGDVVWGLAIENEIKIQSNGEKEKLYKPYVLSLKKTDRAFLMPVKDYLELEAKKNNLRAEK